MLDTLVIATGNDDKRRELADLLDGLPYEVRSLKSYPPVEEPEETGETFEENALLKARYYAARLGVCVVADDSGLCVDALGGAPGVYSARYAGPGCTYADNNEKLLAALAPFLWHERTARFVCCAAYADPAGNTQVVRGTCEGRISMEAFGDNGFGYDPVFVPDRHERTFGEMKPAEKHRLSHRGDAFRKLRTFLEQRGAGRA